MSLVIRPAEDADAVGVLAVQAEAAAERRWIATQPEEIPKPEDQVESRRKLVRDGGILLVAEEGGRIVGLCGLMRGQRLATRHTADLGLTVAASHRGRGVGRALVTAAEAWAARAGIERITLGVFVHNEAARRLYERLGYEVEGMRRGQYRLEGRDVDEILMAKRVLL